MSLNGELLEQSFDKIQPLADEFAASFYEKLFTTHPELKPLLWLMAQSISLWKMGAKTNKLMPAF
jgi:hemoglobin-like flavoprotein